MVNKVHGSAQPGEFMTLDQDFVILRTLEDITPTGVVGALADVNPSNTFPFILNGTSYANAGAYNASKTSQDLFSRLVEVVSQRAQPVILGGVISASESGGQLADLPAGGAGPANVFSVRVSFEHAGAWGENDAVSGFLEDLLNELNGQGTFVFTTPTTGNNISAVKAAVL